MVVDRSSRRSHGGNRAAAGVGRPDCAFGHGKKPQDALVGSHCGHFECCMLITVETNNRPLSPEDVNSFESAWGVQLPDAYRRFLLTFNGGRPRPSTFRISGLEKNPEGQVQMFFGLDTA